MRILCVDDELAALNRLESRVIAVAPNSDIVKFEDAKETLKYLREGNEVDIAFLDIEMMDVDGISLAKEVKAISPKTRVVFVTGFDKYAVESYRMHLDGYILKPVTEEAIKEHLDYFFGTDKKIETTCFGNFSMRVDGKQLHFKRRKSLEFLAVLVNERGGNVSTRQLIDTLFENYDDNSRRMFSTIVSDAKATLEENGFSDIIVSSYGMYSIDTNQLDCDYYKALKGDLKVKSLYLGEYMKQYQWAEKVNEALKNKF